MYHEVASPKNKCDALILYTYKLPTRDAYEIRKVTHVDFDMQW